MFIYEFIACLYYVYYLFLVFVCGVFVECVKIVVMEKLINFVVIFISIYNNDCFAFVCMCDDGVVWLQFVT